MHRSAILSFYLLHLPDPRRVTKELRDLLVILPHSDGPIVGDASNEDSRLLVLEKAGVKDDAGVALQFLQNISSTRVPDQKQAKDCSCRNETPSDVYIARVEQALLLFTKHLLNLLISQIHLLDKVMRIEDLNHVPLKSDPGDGIHAFLIMVVVKGQFRCLKKFNCVDCERSVGCDYHPDLFCILVYTD